MKKSQIVLLTVLGFVCLVAVATPADAREAYLRFPDIHDGTIVFGADGDLWTVSDQGGTARRLTSHNGEEYYPRFSPDGSMIAFTGMYDGNRDIYVVPVTGGEPRRLTWHPGSDDVLEWTPDGKEILFRSRREEPLGQYEIYRIPVAGGDPVKLPVGAAGRLAIDPDTGAYAFNRKERERATWKRYRGGLSPDIWVGHPDRSDYRKITDFGGPDMYPMWHGGRIWFLSDKGGTNNIWSIRPDGTDRRRHTDLGRWDARWPGIGPDGRIAFVMAADIQIFDPDGDTVRKVEIDIPSDLVLTRTRYTNPLANLTHFDLSPDGSRLAVVARGEIFSVPVEKGVVLPVTGGSGAREKWAGFDHEGKRLVYVTDEPLEEEIRTIDAWGRGEPAVVKPAGASGWHLQPVFSPDGKHIAFADQTQTLYFMPAAGGDPVKVDSSKRQEIRDYTWSPDGRWLAYSKQNDNFFSTVYIYDTEERRSRAVTGQFTSDYSPAWDPEGRYLYFISNRSINPILGNTDWNQIEGRNNRLYLVTLRADLENPFIERAGLPPVEEKQEETEAEGPEKKKDRDPEPAPKPVEIDFDGIVDRVVQLDVPRGNYASLSATKSKVFFLSFPIKGMSEFAPLFADSPPDRNLMAFDLEEKKVETFIEGILGYLLQPKAEKLAIQKQPGEIYVVAAAAPPGPALAKGRVDMGGLVLELDPREEWTQIYHEAWRHMRDFYWDEGMAGVDWQAVREQYATLLPRLSSRDDLQDLMGELIGEMSTSHTYVFGGDPGKRVDRTATGLLGTDLQREGDAYRITRIYHGDPADNSPSPLLDPGVNLEEGDYILAVDNLPFEPDRPFLAALANKAGREVVLTVNDRPAMDGARNVVVKTLRGEGDLRYSDWVRRNREYVADRTGGKLGYIHIPDMWIAGMVEFNTWFYPQLDLEGMVVDVRWNGGGAVSSIILERFRRHVLAWQRARHSGARTYPPAVLNGPFVVLVNENSGSDGDMFPQAVQLEGLAPIIGTRSWGGVVGIRGDKSMVDGGFLSEPEFAWWDPAHGWGLENRGVLPDIEVDNLPQDLARGRDAQLDRGIAEAMKLHQQDPPVKPQFGPAPDKSRGGYAMELRDSSSRRAGL